MNNILFWMLIGLVNIVLFIVILFNLTSGLFVSAVAGIMIGINVYVFLLSSNGEV